MNEELFDLISELIERVKFARTEVSKIKMNQADSKLAFIHIGDKEYVNPNILPFNVHCEIVELCKFIREHKWLTEEQLASILNTNDAYFQNLKEVQAKMGNLIQEALSKNEEKHVPLLYANIIITEQMEQKKNSTI